MLRSVFNAGLSEGGPSPSWSSFRLLQVDHLEGALPIQWYFFAQWQVAGSVDRCRDADVQCYQFMARWFQCSGTQTEPRQLASVAELTAEPAPASAICITQQ